MKIISLEIKNFKRWKEIKLDFDSKINNFNAPNGAGKTSIFHAFLWTLGFNVENIAPKENNIVISNIETECKLVLDINGITHEFVRNSKPIFYIDNQKVSTKKAYVKSVCDMLNVDEDNLNIILNTYLFNQDNTKWNWSDRFKMLNKLLELDEKTLSYSENPNYNLLSRDIINRKTPIDMLSMIKQEKKNIEKEKDTINGGIQALEQQIAPLIFDGINEEDLKQEKIQVENDIRNLTEEMILLKSNDLKNKKSLELKALKSELQRLGNERQVEINTINFKRGQLEYDLRLKNNDFSRISKEVEEISTTIENFENNQAICPTCKQSLPEEMIAQNKIDLQKMLESKLNTIDNLNAEITDLKEKINTAPTNIEETENEKMLKKQIEDLEKEIANIDDNDIVVREVELTAEIDILNNRLTNVNNLIYKQQLANEMQTNLEAKRKEILDVANKKILVEQKQEQLNQYFKEIQNEYDKIVRDTFGDDLSFKFFGVKQDGEYAQECVARRNVRGLITTYYEMSLGEKLKTDILTSLGIQKVLGVEFPIWVDNAQDMTDDLPNCENQIIILNTSKIENNLKGEILNGTK